MKRLLILFCILILPALSWGSPYLVCDPYPVSAGVDTFVLAIDGGEGIESPAAVAANGATSLYYDLQSVTPGVHTVTVKAKNTQWSLESDPTPFDFSRPELLSAPSGIELRK